MSDFKTWTIEDYVKDCRAKTIFFSAGNCLLTLRNNGIIDFEDHNGNTFGIHKWFKIQIRQIDLWIAELTIKLQDKDDKYGKIIVHMVNPSGTFIME